MRFNGEIQRYKIRDTGCFKNLMRTDVSISCISSINPNFPKRKPPLKKGTVILNQDCKCTLSAFRNACADSMESVGMTVEAPQTRQVSLMPSSVISAS